MDSVLPPKPNPPRPTSQRLSKTDNFDKKNFSSSDRGFASQMSFLQKTNSLSLTAGGRGGSRIPRRSWALTFQWGSQHMILPNFPKNALN